MKAFKYFLFAMIGLLAISCSDETFAPGNGGDDDDPPIIIGPGNPGGGKPPGTAGGSGQGNTPPDSVTNVGG